MTDADYQFWDNIFSTIRKWRKSHPEYSPKLGMISNKLRTMQLNYIKNLQEYHYRNRKSNLEKAQEIKKEAEELFKKLSKFEMLATLSK